MTGTSKPFVCFGSLSLLLVGTFGCTRPSEEVVVYCALDREFSEPILERFEKETGIHVRVKYDTESTKSVGLAELIIQEKSRPRCDVFWNNEILNTLRLADAGVLEPYRSVVGSEYPESMRSSEDLWYGFAARVRILLVNTELVADQDVPSRLEDLTSPRWKGRVGIAKPLFGTTATHVACLFSILGSQKARELLLRLKKNGVRVLSGNKQVAVEVGAGSLALGLTDTDDALAELRTGRPVRIIFIDTGEDELGLLYIPNTVCSIRGGPHSSNAHRLIDFLLSPEVETELALGKSGQIPLHPKCLTKPNLNIPKDAKPMAVDFALAALCWEGARKFVKQEFTAP